MKIYKYNVRNLKMSKVFDILGYGQIEDYIDCEDLDEEDLTDTQQSSSEESDYSDEDKKPKKDKVIPAILNKSNLPRFALAKKHKHKGNKY